MQATMYQPLYILI